MRETFRKMNLKKKILLSNVFLFVLPGLILFWSIVFIVREEGTREVNQSKLVILNQINDNMEMMFQNVIDYSDFFFRNQEINRLLSQSQFKTDYEEIQTNKSVRKLLRDRWVLYGNSGFYLEILSENGSVSSTLWNEDTEVLHPDISKLKQENWYGLVEGNGYIHFLPTSRSEEFSKDSESVIRAVRALINFHSGRVIGLMDVSIQRQQMEKLLAGGLSDQMQNIILMDESGKVIISRSSDPEDESAFGKISLHKLQDYDYGYFLDKKGEFEYQVCFVTNPTTGWKLIMQEPVRTGAWFGSGYMGVILVSGVFLILAFLMSWYNSQYISHPVRKLQQDMQRVYTGDLSVRTQVETNDEFGRLSIQFNAMLEQIERLIDQLKRHDEEKRVLELQALQAQINPHFLYNTLASIRFLIEMDQEYKAEQSLVALAKLLKRTFSDHRKLILVEEEMEALEQYLILMSNRYPDEFVWEIRVEEEAKGCLIPRISIQPLVENSISHAFGEKEGIGHLTVRAMRRDDLLLIHVIDDGENADLEKINRLLMDSAVVGRSEKVSGIGIRNVHERIKLLFGDAYGVTAEKLEEGGLCLKVQMPAFTKETEEKSDEDYSC